MSVQCVFTCGIDIGAEGADDSGNIRRTAGAAEPLLADRLYMILSLVLFTGLRQHLQRINIEEALSVQCHTGKHGVIQRLLHDIAIALVCLNLQHSSGKKSQTDSRTGFGICRIIGQIVSIRKSLAHMGSSDAAGDVQLLLNNILP